MVKNQNWNPVCRGACLTITPANGRGVRTQGYVIQTDPGLPQMPSGVWRQVNLVSTSLCHASHGLTHNRIVLTRYSSTYKTVPGTVALLHRLLVSSYSKALRESWPLGCLPLHPFLSLVTMLNITRLHRLHSAIHFLRKSDPAFSFTLRVFLWHSIHSHALPRLSPPLQLQRTVSTHIQFSSPSVYVLEFSCLCPGWTILPITRELHLLSVPLFKTLLLSEVFPGIPNQCEMPLPWASTVSYVSLQGA